MIDGTLFLKAYAKFRSWQLGRLTPAEAQQKQLLSLLGRAANTSFGRDHGFSTIKSITDFQAAVPLRKYEDFWEEYWKGPFPVLEDITWPGKVPYFAVSSGTTAGATKYIPYTKEMTRSNTKAGLDVLYWHLQNKPDSKILGGKNFILGGSTDLIEEAPGIYSGDLSGISTKELPWWIKPRYFPPPDLAFLKNWEEKIQKMSERSLREDIRMVSGVPSWMIIFFEKLQELSGDKEIQLNKYFPNLEMIIHGGVNFQPYHHRFAEYLKGTTAELREVYPASEGFIACADRGFGDGMRLFLDHGIFYEFVPLEELESNNPTRHWIGNIERDVNYAVIMTTCAGLWGYVIGDTIRFVDTETPRALVTGRTSYFLSAFGEHLIAEEVDDAITSAAKEINRDVTDYSMGAIFPENGSSLGGHLLFVEFVGDPPTDNQLKQFEMVVDQKLCQRNEDYEAHRAKGYGLLAPKVNPVSPGFFREWMKSRGKLGGQNKVPRLISKPELFDQLREFAEK